MEQNETFVVALGAILGVLLIAIAVLWRRMIVKNPGLPMWRFLRREGITRADAANTVSGKTVKQAELSCSVCGSREECLARLAAGNATLPPANCSNARLFDYFGLRVDQTRK
jgi:hypothetical protein